MVSCLGSLVQLRCGEGGVLQTDIAVCGEHSQCSSHTGFPRGHGCVLSLSTLLRLQAALHGVGPALCAVTVFGYYTKVQIGLGLQFVPSPVRASQAARRLPHTLSLGAVCLLPSVVPASVSTRTSRVRAACVY